MAYTNEVVSLPLPKGWPTFIKHALVLVNSLLKASFDIEIGRRFDCACHDAREHAVHERLRGSLRPGQR